MKLLRKMLRDEFGKVLAFTVLMSAMSVAQVLIWPTIEKMLPAMLKAIPKALQWLVGNMASEGYSYFLISQQFIKVVGMFGGFLAVMLAASAMSREFEGGTFQFLLAQPISRTRVITEKYLFNAGVLFAPVFLSTALSWPAGLLINARVDFFNLLLAGFYGFFVLAAVYSITFAVGTFVDNQMHMISVGVALVFVMGLLAVFQETKYFSIYGWFDGELMLPIINAGSMPWAAVGGFILFSAACYAVALWRFRRVDI